MIKNLKFYFIIIGTLLVAFFLVQIFTSLVKVADNPLAKNKIKINHDLLINKIDRFRDFSYYYSNAEIDSLIDSFSEKMFMHRNKKNTDSALYYKALSIQAEFLLYKRKISN